MRRRRKVRSFYAPVLLLALIYPSAWNRNSAKFAITEFSDVQRRLPNTVVVRLAVLGLF
jgi:hypothetical protein